MEKITYKMKLPLTGIPKTDRDDAKKEVGNYLLEAILSTVSKGESPVRGGSWKKDLSASYKKVKSKYSNKLIANMELHGDLLDSLEFKETKSGVEIGIFQKDQVPKADGHNNFSGKSKLPERRFIPFKNQKFKSDILEEVAAIITNREVGND
jgi:hypothetical protein